MFGREGRLVCVKCRFVCGNGINVCNKYEIVRFVSSKCVIVCFKYSFVCIDLSVVIVNGDLSVLNVYLSIVNIWIKTQVSLLNAEMSSNSVYNKCRM